MGTGEAKAGSKSDNVTEITFEYSFFSAEIKKQKISKLHAAIFAKQNFCDMIPNDLNSSGLNKICFKVVL